eukprot:9577297-Heterocapsa_arctica.AAC.1
MGAVPAVGLSLVQGWQRRLGPASPGGMHVSRAASASPPNREYHSSPISGHLLISVVPARCAKAFLTFGPQEPPRIAVWCSVNSGSMSGPTVSIMVEPNSLLL